MGSQNSVDQQIHGQVNERRRELLMTSSSTVRLGQKLLRKPDYGGRYAPFQ